VTLGLKLGPDREGDPVGLTDGLAVGVKETSCGLVFFGTTFVLPDDLVAKFHKYVPVPTHRLARTVECGSLEYGSQATFTRHDDGHFYYRKDYVSPASGVCNWDGCGQAKVGDVRVRFDYIPDSPATVLALQSSKEDSKRDTFEPYRLPLRASYRLSQLQNDEVPKDGAQGTAQCAGSGLIYHLSEGEATFDECLELSKQSLDVLSPSSQLMWWVCNFVGVFLVAYQLFAYRPLLCGQVPFFGATMQSHCSGVRGVLMLSSLVSLCSEQNQGWA